MSDPVALSDSFPEFVTPECSSAYVVTRVEYENSPTPGHVIRHVSFFAHVTYPPTEVPDAR